MHLFGRAAIMITSSDSPLPWGAGCPINMLGVRLHTMAISGLSRMRSELAHLLIIPSPAPHPVKTNGETTSRGHLCSLASAAHHQMKVLATPFCGHVFNHLPVYRCYANRFSIPLLTVSGTLPATLPCAVAFDGRRRSLGTPAPWV